VDPLAAVMALATLVSALAGSAAVWVAYVQGKRADRLYSSFARVQRTYEVEVDSLRREVRALKGRQAPVGKKEASPPPPGVRISEVHEVDVFPVPAVSVRFDPSFELKQQREARLQRAQALKELRAASRFLRGLF
jgi:hypothetical protein